MTRIREIRLAREMTQEELAKRLHVKPPAVSKWELGKCNPQFDMAVRIADVLGCTLDDLAGRGSRPGA